MAGWIYKKSKLLGFDSIFMLGESIDKRFIEKDL